MSDISNIMSLLWEFCKWGGGIIAAFGVFRWIMHGRSRDAAEQADDIWVIAAGAALVVIGTAAPALFPFPSM